MPFKSNIWSYNLTKINCFVDNLFYYLTISISCWIHYKGLIKQHISTLHNFLGIKSHNICFVCVKITHYYPPFAFGHTRRKTSFFNYVFNSFSTIIYSWKHHFQLQNVFCNSKMMLSTNFQNNQHCWVSPTTQLKTMYICQFVGWCWGDNILVETDIHFNQYNISTIKCWRDLIDSMLASQWMNFIHLHVMSFGGVEFELWLFFNYITTNVTLAHVMSLKKGMEF
jgi:hypothetical protein